jgi:hypothetical protein
MSFPLSSEKILGYDPAQVDALIIRVGKQLATPGGTLVTAAMLKIARFERIAGGYQVRAVDQALGKMVDSLLENEAILEIGKLGISNSKIILEQMLEAIKLALDLGVKRAFPRSQPGYNQKRTKNLMAKVLIKDGVLSVSGDQDLRAVSLGKSASGPGPESVDDFLTLVIRALLFQRLLPQ